MDTQQSILKKPGRLIALNGLAGSGKTTVAQYLWTSGFARVKFAGPLKTMLRAFYGELGLSDGEIYKRIEGDLKEVPDIYLDGQTPRHAMQTLGTDWGRNRIDSDFWVNTAKRRLRELLYKGENVVIDDLRFPNEALAVRDMGGEVWRVVRPGQDRIAQHESESYAPNPDKYILNTTSVTALFTEVDVALEEEKCIPV